MDVQAKLEPVDQVEHFEGEVGENQLEEGMSSTLAKEVLGTEVHAIVTGQMGDFDGSQLVFQTVGGQEQLLNTDSASMGGTFVADPTTLHNLIAAGAVQITDSEGHPVQIFTLPNEQNVTDTKIKSDNEVLDTESGEAESGLLAHLRDNSSSADSDAVTRMGLLTASPSSQNFPIGTPPWAMRLRECQQIGDYYRGWLTSEVELDLVLTLHKQHTHSMWGTRQSPCPSKPATRLMWKSQYVPFDGMPFLNAGSRAVVQECQFGPRRKGSNTRKDEMAALKSDFKQTCPARIYIKKVKKYIEYQVNMSVDKKNMKVLMDKAFQEIKEKEYEGLVQERFYVQLPTEKAHEFHTHDNRLVEFKIEKESIGKVSTPSRIHPLVAEKIRDCVSMGETRLYVIRKQLRKFVEKELVESMEGLPDKHNLHYFPTVNDLQNHIHQAVRDIDSGILPVQASAVNLELVSTAGQLTSASWQKVSTATPHPETVTLTLTQKPGQEGHIISNVETNLSDGTKHITKNLTPATAKLLAKINPHMFTGFGENSEGSLLEATEVSLPDTAASDTSAERTSQSTDAEYTVLQTANGPALLLTKPDLTHNSVFQVQPSSVEMDQCSVLPVFSEADILQSSEGGVVQLVGDGKKSTDELNECRLEIVADENDEPMVIEMKDPPFADYTPESQGSAGGYSVHSDGLQTVANGSQATRPVGGYSREDIVRLVKLKTESQQADDKS